MTYFLIGDEDTVLGFAMVGVSGRVVANTEETESAFQDAISGGEAGIIIITEQAADFIRSRIENYMFTADFPLIVEIPGPERAVIRHGRRCGNWLTGLLELICPDVQAEEMMQINADTTVSGSGGEAVIQGILDEARDESGKIRRQAEEKAKKDKSDTDVQCMRIMQQAQDRAEELRASFLAAEKSAVDAELRRRSLAEQEKIYGEFFSRLRDRLLSLPDTTGYREILRGWIVEASIGLGAEKVEILASGKERELIDHKLLKEVEAAVHKSTRRRIELNLSTEEIEGRGVFLRDETGRLAFDNRIDARIRRSRRDLVRTIADALSTVKKV